MVHGCQVKFQIGFRRSSGIRLCGYIVRHGVPLCSRSLVTNGLSFSRKPADATCPTILVRWRYERFLVVRRRPTRLAAGPYQHLGADFRPRGMSDGGTESLCERQFRSDFECYAKEKHVPAIIRMPLGE